VPHVLVHEKLSDGVADLVEDTPAGRSWKRSLARATFR